MLKRSLAIVIIGLSGCMSTTPGYYAVNNGGYSNNQQYGAYDHQQYMSREELEKYNGIRVGADGRVKSLVQLPTYPLEQMPHWNFTRPSYVYDGEVYR